VNVGSVALWRYQTDVRRQRGAVEGERWFRGALAVPDRRSAAAGPPRKL